METRAHPPGLQDVLTFPLIEALYGRRARRFSLGASIPDGPLAFTSRHDPLPLSELEQMLVLTAAAGNTGGQLVEEALAFPHKQSVEAFQAQVDVCLAHDTQDRLAQISAPTLVLSGKLDIILGPRFGRSVAAAIPNARFEVMAGEAHQPFQEVPEEFNARVEAFWGEVEARS